MRTERAGAWGPLVLVLQCWGIAGLASADESVGEVSIAELLSSLSAASPQQFDHPLLPSDSMGVLVSHGNGSLRLIEDPVPVGVGIGVDRGLDDVAITAGASGAISLGGWAHTTTATHEPGSVIAVPATMAPDLAVDAGDEAAAPAVTLAPEAPAADVSAAAPAPEPAVPLPEGIETGFLSMAPGADLAQPDPAVGLDSRFSEVDRPAVETAAVLMTIRDGHLVPAR